MLPEKLHDEGLAVDLPVHHLLPRQNVLLRLPDSGLIVPSQQIGVAQVCPPFRIAHALIENPFDLTPDAMLQCRQSFENLLQPVPLVNSDHEAVAGHINGLEELPFLFHRVEFNAVFVVETVVVMLIAH